MMACRHCYGKDEFKHLKKNDSSSSSSSVPPKSASQNGNAFPSYVERLVYGKSSSNSSPECDQVISSVLDWVESKATGNSNEEDSATPMPGITVWCHHCKRVSVISYSYYLLLSRNEDKLPEDKILSLSCYYTRMCIGAEMWMNMAQVALQPDDDN